MPATSRGDQVKVSHMQLDSFADFCRLGLKSPELWRHLSAQFGFVHEVTGTRRDFLLTSFSQICSQELSLAVFGQAGFIFNLPLLLSDNKVFLLVLVIFVLKVKVVPPIYGFKLL